MCRKLLAMVVPLGALAQTQVDLQRQSKSIDLRAASYTRPIKTGPALPATCSVGEMFFNTSAGAGVNVFGCVGVNTWALQSGGGGQGTVTISTEGTPIGTRGVVNFIAGTGVLNAFTDSGSQVNIQQGSDTAVLLSRSTGQSGSDLLCSSAGGSTTMNVDTLGAVAVKQFDGTTDPAAADIVANRLYPLWYDGAVFRLMIPPVNVAATAARPTCSAAQRGRIWQTLGAATVKDDVTVCAKDTSDV